RSAFNALLKILEEPPEHVIFIFATTEIEQVPDTVLSRCQRFDFRLIPTPEIASSLQSICEAEDIDVEDEALFLIAKFAEGSLRDAQSILDQMISFAEGGDQRVTEELVSDTWGIAPYDQLLSFLEAFQEEDKEKVLGLLDDHLRSGKDIMALISDLSEMIRNVMMARENPDADFLSEGLPEDVVPRLQALSEDFRTTELTWMFEQLLDLHQSLRQHSRFQRELTEVEFVRLTEGRPKYNLSEIVDRLETMESSPGKSISRQESDADTSTESDGVVGEAKQDTVSKESGTSRSGGESPAESDDSGESPVDSPESDTAVQNLSDENWEELLGAVPNPARAYLRNSSRARVDDGRLTVDFSDEYANHVDQLAKDKYQRQIQDACREVLGGELELVFSVEDSKKNDNSDGMTDETKSLDKGEEFLRQTR
ncbi:MAG: hypothetical protein ABEK50_16915, partial [bacterium]